MESVEIFDLVDHLMDVGDWPLTENVLSDTNLNAMNVDDLIAMLSAHDAMPEHIRSKVIDGVVSAKAVSHDQLRTLALQPLSEPDMKKVLTTLKSRKAFTSDQAELLLNHAKNGSRYVSATQLKNLLLGIEDLPIRLKLLAHASADELIKLTKGNVTGLIDEAHEECGVALAYLISQRKSSGRHLNDLYLNLLGKVPEPSLGIVVSVIAKDTRMDMDRLLKQFYADSGKDTPLTTRLSILTSVATLIPDADFRTTAIRVFEDKDVSIPANVQLLATALEKRNLQPGELATDLLKRIVGLCRGLDPEGPDFARLVALIARSFEGTINAPDAERLGRAIKGPSLGHSLLNIALAMAARDWVSIRLCQADLKGRVPAPCAAFINEIALRGSVIPYASLVTKKKKAFKDIIEPNGILSNYTEAGEPDVLILCERGAQPDPVLSIDTPGDLILCSMDDVKSQPDGKPLTLWSLRDLLPDTDSITTQMYADGKRISEKIVQAYQEMQSRHYLNMAPHRISRILSIGLEDALMGQLVMGGCFAQALRQFDGDEVVLVQSNGMVTGSFVDSFARLTSANIKLSYPGRNYTQALKSSMAGTLVAKIPDAGSGDRGGIEGYFEQLKTVSFKGHFDSMKSELSGKALVFMGSFGDPIYIANIIPALTGLLEKHTIFILEGASPDVTRAALVDTFGADMKHPKSGKKIVLVDMTADIREAMLGMDMQGSVIRDIAMECLANLSPADLTSGGLNVTRMLLQRSPKWISGILTRLELASAYIREFLETVPVNGFLACSERPALHMIGVEAANRLGIPSVDMMAVNSIRLPRYKPPFARLCTAVDTISEDYLADFHGLPRSRITVTGSPRHDAMISSYKSINANDIRTHLDIPEDAPVILVVSQLQPIERFIDIFRRAVDAAEASGDAYVLVKLHRRENLSRQEIYRQAAEASAISDRIRLIYDDPVMSKIETSLKISDVVVSMYSNVLREAACVGLPIIVADYFGTELPFDYAEAGLGRAAKTPEQLTELLLDVVKGQTDPSVKARADAFLEKNPQLFSGDSAKQLAKLF